MASFGSRSKKPGLAEFRAAASNRPAEHRYSGANFRVTDKGSTGMAAAMISLGVFVLAFCATALVAAGDDGRSAAWAGSAIFVPTGVAMILGGIGTKARRRTAEVSNDRVIFENKRLSGMRRFEEPLSAYLCVLPQARILASRQYIYGMSFYATLVHGTDPRRNVGILVHSLDQLGMVLDQGTEREPMEDFARLLDLPLASVDAYGNVRLRNPDELDRPMVGRTRDWGPVGPESPFPSRRYRITESLTGFAAERGYLGYLIPFLAFLAAGVACRLFVTDGEARLILPMTAAVFALFMLAFSLMRSRLELRDGTLEARYSLAGFPLIRRTVRLAEVEEVSIIEDPQSRRRALSVASDKATITWAIGDPEETIVWFRDAVLRALARLHP